LHLTGFIHDLGKVLGHPKMFDQPQWAVVGDTFPTGCAYSPSIVFSEFFSENPDFNHPTYSTKVSFPKKKKLWFYLIFFCNFNVFFFV
jgi:inositol oxygenase